MFLGSLLGKEEAVSDDVDDDDDDVDDDFDIEREERIMAFYAMDIGFVIQICLIVFVMLIIFALCAKIMANHMSRQGDRYRQALLASKNSIVYKKLSEDIAGPKTPKCHRYAPIEQV